MVSSYFLFDSILLSSEITCYYRTQRKKGTFNKNFNRNIPILPMAFLTFAEAKVWSAPPFVPRTHAESACWIPESEQEQQDHETCTNFKKAPLREGPNDEHLLHTFPTQAGLSGSPVSHGVIRAIWNNTWITREWYKAKSNKVCGVL